MSNPDPVITNAPLQAGYFARKTPEDHRKRCIDVMRRGTQQRLQFAISKLAMISDPYDSELSTLAVARKELKTLETAMRRSGQLES